jgi:hypothetical protein
VNTLLLNGSTDGLTWEIPTTGNPDAEPLRDKRFLTEQRNDVSQGNLNTFLSFGQNRIEQFNLIILWFGQADNDKQIYVQVGVIECGDGSMSRGILAHQDNICVAFKKCLRGFLDAGVKLDPFYIVWRHELSNRYVPPITASEFGVGVLVSSRRVAQKLLKSSLSERRMSLRSW